MSLKHLLSLFAIICLFPISGQAQVKNTPKYNSLLWEISGNGLKKPSYLFGTMHVSSKLAFHLSDSFYHALKNVNAVALELNPESWQAQMVRLNALNENYAAYVEQPGNDYLSEGSFRIYKYEDLLKMALSSEPPVVNSLLYRSYKAREDFEEDTFLDLYIFQTGRKLGKIPAGVEDYYESEKLVLEAYADMAKEKKKPKNNYDGESSGSMVEKMQKAYRRGDLDLMDSLDNVMERSPAFREKFLFKRNEIQANAIDSIIKTMSLFAGVGAAHLPGERGVIELLRKKGYTLRPIKMTDRDAHQKELIDKMKVEVTFRPQQAPDGMFNVDVPGELYALKSNYIPLNRWQYADMNNGSYYLVTRIKTYSAFLGTGQQEVMRKIDSLLYEHIPGKILSRKTFTNDGYPGYDITNRTRRGDLQRYRLYVTPFEIIIFKMSGKADYVDGKEAQRFFSSIRLKSFTQKATRFQPPQGGFSIQLPHEPHQVYQTHGDGRWEYEAMDSINQEAYLVMKRTNYNFNFIESDSFDLSLVEESFRNPELFGTQLERRMTTIQGSPALLVKEQLKTGQVIEAAHILKGPHYLVVSKRIGKAAPQPFNFVKSFSWQPYKYPAATEYRDTFLRVSIQTPVQPKIDAGIRTIIEQTAADQANGNNTNGYIAYWQKLKNGSLKSDSTGELVSIQVQEYPKYYYIRDSAKFWKAEIDDYLNKNDMVLRSMKPLAGLPGGAQGFHVTVQDTGSSRIIERIILLKDKYIYTLAAVTDSAGAKSSFLADVFKSVQPLTNGGKTNLYENKLGLFFSDMYSKDSATSKKARQSISNIYFGSAGAEGLFKAINTVSISEPDYFNIKTRLIAELGYISDSVNNNIPVYLEMIYHHTADTALFQNEVLKALARLKTQESFKVLKNIMLQDPPVFEDNDQYDNIFDHMQDTLALAAGLFPDLYQLTTLQDYKEPITQLLVSLVDSGYIKGPAYAQHYNTIYIDAKVAQKKQQAKDEKQMQLDKKRKDENEEETVTRTYNYNSNRSELNDYAVLLMPFYDKPNVKQYFARLLESKDPDVRMNAAVHLLRNNIPVADSIIAQLAEKDKYRGRLYQKLEAIKRLDRFPAGQKNQLAMARSFLVMESEYNTIDTLSLLQVKPAIVKGKTGQVYFFKYRLGKEDDWKIGVSGVQPMDEKQVSSNNDLVSLTGIKLKEQEPLQEQLDRQLKILLFSFHKSAKNFFRGDGVFNDFKSMSDYEDD